MRPAPALALVLLLLGLAAGAVRWSQTRLTLPGEQVQFSVLHAVNWDAHSRQLRRTGEDPYVLLALPAACGPIRQVTFEFAGPPAPGPTKFYVYPSSAYLQGIEFDDAHLVLGTVTAKGDSHAIRYVLNDSRVVRLDLPDDLAEPVELRRVTVVSAFHGHASATLVWLLLGAAAVVGFGARLADALAHRAWIEPVLALGLIALKLALTSDLHLSVLPLARHDDLLFLHQAQSLMQGGWLGTYDEIILTKGPAYPLFLALVGKSGMPLLLVETLMQALAAVLLVRALRPLMPSPTARLLLLGLLLLDPHTFSGAAVGRVLRSGIQPALTMFVLAGCIGLATRIRRAGRGPLAWSLLAGAALAGFWHCREEGIWLLPSVALLLAATVVPAWRAGPALRSRGLALVALPIMIVFVSSEAIRALNNHWYAALITVDVRDGSFPDAYGALLRLKPDRFFPRVPVSHAVRLRAYAASPAFAELQPFLEGDIGGRWIAVSQGAEPDPDSVGEIQGGWFQWALREAAAAAGHGATAGTADAYWHRVAGEVNAAADQGRIPAGSARTGFLPPWHRSRWRPLVAAFRDSWGVMGAWSDFSVQFPPRPAPETVRVLVDAVTHESLTPDYAPTTGRTAARLALADIYRWAGYIVSGPALLAALLAAGWMLRRGPALSALILLALAGGAVALVLVAALVEATSFHAAASMYLAPATPLLLTLWVLGPLWLLQRPGEDAARFAAQAP